MAVGRFIGLLTVAVVLVSVSLPQCLSENITRGSFPEGFVFGTASSAFQYEGAVQEDGRGLTVWDNFSHTAGNINDGSNADVAVDQYHLYPDDIQLMKSMGMDAYRFSISWSRIFPDGTGKINQAGVDHYNRLINALIAEGIEPYVTLYHWDLPQALEDKYKGWLDPQIINDFALYAETCFEEFGDRVKQWITFNEPHSFILQGYDFGTQPPGRCSIHIPFVNTHACTNGNSSTEPYIVARHVLLSHATASQIYRNNYKEEQKGSVGLSFSVLWLEPITNSTEDIEAAQRFMEFQLGWFLDPLMFGDYPKSMRSRVGSRLPSFTKDESALVKGSLDFVGINHYTTFYAYHNTSIYVLLNLNDTLTDSGVFVWPFDKHGQPIGDRANSIWLYIVPRGMRSLMNYINHKYGNPPVFITENGMDDANDPSISIEDALKDEKRIKYHNDYLQSLLDSIKEDGCNVKGYFAWSLLDNWEWQSGFTSRFGLVFVDYNDKLKRYPKNSVQWFQNFLNSP